ncbi:hypothetical protein Hrd1104_12210 [Halorhabdus sp. CBA1104]|uniref:hypothetical protein n=1 Tax=unclassified Halorhabdus TaxID=2621901 RepID=UPI0012B3C59B|nr:MULTISPECIES: hypothetical protein [unclassified Halorhabdus]QGN07984.1 hypothetical protein Hrd1104_12210 [Halorhabdus sp. CBA1104]
MNSVTDRFADRLEPIGIVTGAFLVVVGLGTMAGQPWSTNGSALVSAVQLLGVAGMVAIGVGLAWLARSE